MATAKNSKITPVEDELIVAGEIVVSSRGRTKELNPAVIASLNKLPEPDADPAKRPAMVLASLGQALTKEDKAKVAGIVRKNWDETRFGATHKPRIDFTPAPTTADSKPEGLAQVRVGKLRPVASA